MIETEGYAPRTDEAQYYVGHDIKRIQAVLATRGTEGFDERLEQTKEYFETQLVSDFGERVGVRSKTFRYEIRGERLHEPGREESFDEVIERGINERVGGKKDDRLRERIELDGFKAIQNIMTNPHTRDGTTILYISPGGDGCTNYQKNYFDEIKKTGKEVIVTRYLSNLTNEQYREKAISLNSSYGETYSENPDDIEFLSTPVIIPPFYDFSEEDSLAEYMLDGKLGISKEEFNVMIRQRAGNIVSYLKYLEENPTDYEFLELSYRSILNKRGIDNLQIDGMVEEVTKEQIIYEGKQHVHMQGGGCGSGACSIEGKDPLVEALNQIFTPDKYGDRVFKCDCGTVNIRYVENQLIELCEGCKNPVLPPGMRNNISNQEAQPSQ